MVRPVADGNGIDIVDDDGNDVGENVAERDGTTVGLRFFQNGMVEQYPDYKSAFFCSLQ